MGHSKNSRALFYRLIQFLLLDKRNIQLVIFYSVGVSLLNLILPLGAQSIFSNINYGTVIQPVLIITFIVFCVLSMSATLQSFQVYLVETVQKKIFARTTLSISEFIPRVKWEAFDRINGMELMNRFFEVLHVQKMQALILMDGLSIFLQIVIGLCLIAFYHPYLLAYDLLLIFGLFVVIFKMGAGTVDTSIAESKQKYKIASWLEEIARNKTIFESKAGSEFAVLKTDQLVSEYITKRHSHFLILFRQYIGTYALYVVSSVGLFALGGWLVVIGELSLGQLVAAEIIVSGIVTSVSKIGKYLESIYDLAASFDKLESIFDLPVDASGMLNFSNQKLENIDVQNLTYRYEHGDKQIGPFDFTFKSGQKIALVGSSGIGKSTLSEILAGHRTPSSGKIRLNGIDLHQICSKDVSSIILLVSQPQLFAGTILENITLGKDDTTHESVLGFIKQCPFANELLDLPQGLNTAIIGHPGEFSYRISAIITLLRALYAQPQALIIDQVLDMFDADLQHAIVNYLKSHFPDMMVLMITSHESLACQFAEQMKLGGES